MSKTAQIFAVGLTVALVSTALLLPGRQTIGAVQATGQAGSGLIKSAEGQ